MNLSSSPARHHAGSRPTRPRPVAPPADPIVLNDDDGPLPPHLRRSAPTPSAVGITPGWVWLLRDGESVIRSQLRRALHRQRDETAAAIDLLASQVAALREQVEALERRPSGGEGHR